MLTSFNVGTMPANPVPESDKKVTIGVRVAPFVLDGLTADAAKDDRTISYVAAKILEQHYSKPSKPKR